MIERQFPADETPSGPWGPPPSAPPTLSPQQPYVDPFAGMSNPPPPAPPKRHREGLWIALAAVIGAAAVIGGVAWYTQRDTTDEARAGRDVTQQTEDAAPEGAAPEDAAPEAEAPSDGEQADNGDNGDNTACPGGTPQQVCDAAAYVENFRGRPFQTFPVVEFADEGDFQDRLLDDELDDDDIAEIETDENVLGSLGLIAPGDDLVDVSRQLSEISVVGFYDPESAELVVRGSEINLYVELVIVHELVHAHDDQWLDLDLDKFDDADDESSFGYRSIIEGNASRVEQAWRAELSEAEEEELSLLEASLFDPDDIAILQRLPLFLLLVQASPYRDGPELVRAIAAAAGGGEAGERAVDAAFDAPPPTSEQALHPEKFLSGEANVSVPAPPASGEVIDEGVIGELVFDAWLGNEAGDGWNGDRYVSFERDGQTCTVVRVAADSARDLDELADAAANWVGDAVEDDVRRSDQTTVDGIDIVIIEGCR